MSKEQEISPFSGWLILPLNLILLVVCGIAFWVSGFSMILLSAGILIAVGTLVSINGYFVLEPNGSMVLTLTGKYKGTVKKDGFFWVNPLLGKRRLSLRARTLMSETLKVNDQTGNPIEIASISVWKVDDTYSASFDVEYYEQYVKTQSETALRHLASAYPYDAEDNTVSLRKNMDEVSKHLQEELQQVLVRAGVNVLEAKLSHLAYAPEIASVMLRRQQAAAIISARQKIVEGAVGMVDLALRQLEEKATVKLDEERKAAMVSNLLVVLCSDHGTEPVINTGTLYH